MLGLDDSPSNAGFAGGVGYGGSTCDSANLKAGEHFKLARARLREDALCGCCPPFLNATYFLPLSSFSL